MNPTRVALALVTLLSVARSDEPINIKSRRELFVDDYLVKSLKGARLTLHHPRAREVALRFDQPWEGNTSGYPTVMQDGDTYKMIYRAHHMVWDNGKLQMAWSPLTCYAESSDGIHWTKPHLRQHLLRGHLAKLVGDPLNNNIIWPGSNYSGNIVPFIDARPGCPPDEKFKAVGGNRLSGLHLFTSPDARKWTKRDKALFNRGALDSQNVMFWSSEQQNYVVYYRTVVDGRRDVSMTTSSDLQSWSKSIPLTYPGSPPQQMYTNGIQPYHRAPHISLGFPTRYVARKMTPQLNNLGPVKLRSELTAAYARVGSDLTDGLFMSSRDGVSFHRYDEAFLRPGPEARDDQTKWIYGDNYQSYGLFETKSTRAGEPRELSMLVSEGYWRKGKSLLRRYSIRLDGFVSIQAPFSGGDLRTKLVRFDGKRLRLNYSTSAAGSVRVEIQDSNGKPIPGYALNDCVELIGDSVDHTVRWKRGSDTRPIAGKPVQLRIVMKDADLYAFQFGD